MNARLLAWLAAPVAILLLVQLCLALFNRGAYFQRPEEVVIRDPGKRMLGPPQDVGPQAREDLPFALLSQAVYKKPVDDEKIKAGEALNPDAALKQLGWFLWCDFPDGDLKRKVDAVHLRLQVWSNPSERKVAVAFGGTVARNSKDWISDLRWFIPYKHDEYTVIVESLGNEFISEYNRRASLSGWEYLRTSQLFSTGHSLGGGLAQEFAYSLPIDQGVGPVTKVYAFDPSPVTGFFSVEKPLRDHNRENLKIDRIYERGEILAIVRSFTHFVAPPAAQAPAIRQIRYNLFYTRNPFAGHSMAEFAFQMYRKSGLANTFATNQ